MRLGYGVGVVIREDQKKKGEKKEPDNTYRRATRTSTIRRSTRFAQRTHSNDPSNSSSDKSRFSESWINETLQTAEVSLRPSNKGRKKQDIQMTHGAVDPRRTEMLLFIVELTRSVGSTFRMISVLIDRGKLSRVRT